MKLKSSTSNKWGTTLLAWVAVVTLAFWGVFIAFAIVGLIISNPLLFLQILVGIGLYWLGYSIGKEDGKKAQQ